MAVARKGNNICRCIIDDEPLETFGSYIALPKRGILFIHAIYFRDRALHLLMLRVLHQVPVQRLRCIPLLGLRKLRTHKEQLLARVRPHKSIESAQVSQLLPAIARHLRDHRSFAMHHLVVREGEQVIFRPGVEDRLGYLVVVIDPINWIFLDVLQGVMHPTHVPLEAKAESTTFGRTCYTRPRSGLFSDHHATRNLAITSRGELLQEPNRTKIFTAAKFVRDPLPLIPRIIQVEHRRNSIYADSIDMKLFEPVQGTCD